MILKELEVDRMAREYVSELVLDGYVEPVQRCLEQALQLKHAGKRVRDWSTWLTLALSKVPGQVLKSGDKGMVAMEAGLH
jgi:hypothetical protein